MNKFFKGVMLAAMVVIGATALTGCERVQPGEVGIKVNKLGDDKGVGEVVGVGRVWTGWNTELYTFPTFKQMKTYDEPFSFQMSDGTAIGHKIGVAYRVDPTKVTTVFQAYRKGVDEITDTELRQQIADTLNRLSSRMTTDKFIDGGKADLLSTALAELQAKMDKVGIEVMSLSWIDKPIYPETVIASINAKVTANQTTLQRIQEVQQSKAEADKKIEEARGEAQSTMLRAKAEADAINLRGSALRDNPEVIKLNLIEKWDGKLPVYQGGNGPTSILDVTNAGK